MKKLSLLSTLVAFVALSAGAQSVTIRGKMEFTHPVKMVYLMYSNGTKRITDSTKLVNNHFQIKTKIVQPSVANLFVRFEPTAADTKAGGDGMQLFIEPGTMVVNVKDSMKFAKVSGSKSQKDFEIISKMKEPFDKMGSSLNAEYMKYRQDKDEAGMQKISDEFGVLDSSINEDVYHRFLKKHPASPVSLYALENYAGYDIDAKKVEPLYAKLSLVLKKSPSGKAFKERIETAKKTGIGAYAMNFTQSDTLGKPVSLSEFRGKYVLLDFWASWCGPCRAENPNVVKAFNKYENKNFTVLSVSLDQPGKKQAWLDAIHKDNLTWTHVSDLKFWDNAVAKQYGIRAIPQNLLLDSKGKIIAKNIRGEELNKKLEEVLK